MKLFYRKSGNGPPLFILHGLYGSSDNWVTFSKRLEDSFTVYLPDLRNHGLSPHHNEHDYSSMGDDLYELVSELKTGRIFLAGHSMGGKAAVAFALKWPDLVRGLLVADVSPFKTGSGEKSAYSHHLTILDSINECDLSMIKTREEADSALARTIDSERERGLLLKNLRRKSASEFEWKLNIASLRSNINKIMEGIDPRYTVEIPVTGFPVIFLRAEQSGYLPLSDFAEIQRIFPSAEFITIKGASHWIQVDKPAEVAEYIRKLNE